MSRNVISQYRTPKNRISRPAPIARVTGQRVRALDNQIRGLLGEYGLSIPQGKAVVKRRVAERLEDASKGSSDRFHRLLWEAWHQFQELEAHIQTYDQELARMARESEACRRLQTARGSARRLPAYFSASSVTEKDTVGDEMYRRHCALRHDTQYRRQDCRAGYQQTRGQRPAKTFEPWRPSGGYVGV